MCGYGEPGIVVPPRDVERVEVDGQRQERRADRRRSTDRTSRRARPTPSVQWMKPSSASDAAAYGRRRIGRGPDARPGRGGTSGASARRLVDRHQARSRSTWMTVGAVGGEGGPQRRLELGVALDADAARAAGPGDRREVDRRRARSRPRRRSRAAPATSGSCRSARCRRRRRRPARRRGPRSRARPSSSPGRRRRRAPRPGDRDGRAPRRSPPAGRSPSPPTSGPRNVPGRRNRKPRPAQPAKLPASVVRIASSGRTRRSVAIVRPGMDARAVPRRARRRPTPPPRRPGRRGCWPGASRRARRRARPARAVARWPPCRNALASAATVIVGAGEPVAAPGTRSTCAQRRPARGIV